MNRRNFLKTTGAMTALGATTHLFPRRALAQSSAGLYANATQAHTVAVGNMFYGTTQANDWYNIEAALGNCMTDWQNSGKDAAMQSAVQRVSAASIHSSAMNQAALLQQLQTYKPQATIADIQTALILIDQNAAQIPTILSNIASYGMISYLSALHQQAYVIGNGLANGSITAANARAAVVATRSMVVAASGAGMSPFVKVPPPKPGDGGTLGHYNCATDGALIFASGLAFATLAVMTMGAGAVLAGAAWEGIALWGGMGVTGWGVGHAVAGCGF